MGKIETIIGILNIIIRCSAILLLILMAIILILSIVYGEYKTHQQIYKKVCEMEENFIR